MKNDADRFLVARDRNAVIIRQVVPCSSTLEFTRPDAWQFAKRLAKGAKNAQDRYRREPVRIEFVALDGSRTIVQTAAQSKALRPA